MPNGSSVLYRDLRGTPLTIARGSGVFVEDDRGRRYLDGNASAGVVAIGHGRTEIGQAIAAAGDALTFVYGGGFTHKWQEQLAEALRRVAPPGMAAVYFSSGGSEANETAIKLARQVQVERGRAQKHKVVARWQSYHGVTLACLALSGRTSWRSLYAPYLFDVPRVAPPYRYRCAFCAAHEACTLACADDLERTILLEGPETVAAFIAEPVVGTTATGLTPDVEYYRRIREICDRYDVLFIADEVLCGYGRTGKPTAIAHWDVTPDIVTLGKGIASGYAPLGATIVSQAIVDALRRGSGRVNHGFTYSGMPLSCFVGLEVFAIMQREGLFERAATLGALLFGELERLRQKYPVIGEVRGKGLLAGIELVADRATRAPFPLARDLTRRLVAAMRARGVLVGAGVPQMNFGKDGDHIQISPPLTISAEEIGILIAALDESLAELAR
jgi:adenosylmethionine-8-amino-7-oxononanoate aminotransferase